MMVMYQLSLPCGSTKAGRPVVRQVERGIHAIVSALVTRRVHAAINATGLSATMLSVDMYGAARRLHVSGHHSLTAHDLAFNTRSRAGSRNLHRLRRDVSCRPSEKQWPRLNLANVRTVVKVDRPAHCALGESKPSS